MATRRHHHRDRALGSHPFVQQREPELLLTQADEELQIGRCGGPGAVVGTGLRGKDEADAVGVVENAWRTVANKTVPPRQRGDLQGGRKGAL